MFMCFYCQKSLISASGTDKSSTLHHTNSFNQFFLNVHQRYLNAVFSSTASFNHRHINKMLSLSALIQCLRYFISDFYINTFCHMNII